MSRPSQCVLCVTLIPSQWADGGKSLAWQRQFLSTCIVTSLAPNVRISEDSFQSQIVLPKNSHPPIPIPKSSCPLLGKSTLVPSCLLLFQPYYAKQDQSIICDNLELQRQAWNPNQLISTAANLWFRIHPPPPPCYGDILFGNITTNPSMISTIDAVDLSLKVSLMTSSVLVCSLLDSTTMPSRDFFCFADCSCSSH